MSQLTANGWGRLSKPAELSGKAGSWSIGATSPVTMQSPSSSVELVRRSSLTRQQGVRAEQPVPSTW